MHLAQLDLSALRFRTSEVVLSELRAACDSNPDIATFDVIGSSREGRPIAGVTLGFGPKIVTLIAGAHADEPVGPETLRTLILEGLAARGWGTDDGGLSDLFDRFTFRVIPHVNPDGEARNRPWINAWPDFGAYLRHRVREKPGDDIEFGYPDMRPENEAASAFLFDGEPVALHASLHGMGLSEGALLLLSSNWLTAGCGDRLRKEFAEAAEDAGLRLHDHDRKGAKGFHYGGPGFTSTPSGVAMRAHFESNGDHGMARRFHMSSMDLAAARGAGPDGDQPLSLVTELPLYQLAAVYEHEPGVPGLLMRYQRDFDAILEAVRSGADLSPWADPLGLRPVRLDAAVACHLRTLDAALESVQKATLR